MPKTAVKSAIKPAAKAARPKAKAAARKTAAKPRELAAHKLKAALDPRRIPYRDSREIPGRDPFAQFQPRATQALSLSLVIAGNEHNVYLAGDANLGRSYFARAFLTPAAAKLPTPPDWIYVHNFADPDRPLAVSLPAGEGRKLKTAQAKALAEIRSEILARFDQDAYHKKHELLLKRFNKRRDTLFGQMESTASRNGFALEMDDQGGLTLTPLLDGKIVAGPDFERLEPGLRKRLKAKGDALLGKIGGFLRRINQTEQGLRTDELDLHREIAKAALAEHLGWLRENYGHVERLRTYYDALDADVLANIEHFLPRETPPHPQSQPPPYSQEPAPVADDFFTRYEINLFVDNGQTRGAPVVVEDHPTPFNLLGSIEREAEMGALYTDFTLIRPGAVHRANHGFLILNVEDLLANPPSWEGLLRALRLGKARIEDPMDPEQVRARTIEPEPIPLTLRVVVIGTDENYENLLYHDDRFGKFFKLKAHLQHTAPRNAANVERFLLALGRIIEEAALLPFGREALAGLVDFSSRLAEDQKKLSLHFPLVRERMIEASTLAALAGETVVDAKRLAEAVAARDFRANLFEEEFMADYDREVIKVATGGFAVGRANGLSVTFFGDYEFGLPHQISCTAGVGHGGILDLEREAQLGGPIHTKGMMIIKSYLVRLFAQDRPIVLTGSLCFEQSYAGVEGDSASGAELAALLSALSGAPINLAFAFTGAIGQSGAVMAVGAVNRKIEGFFEVCRRRGLTGEQGVLVPADNAINLMLKDEVVEAVRRGRFHIHPVATIEEAMRILTGLPAGERGKSGRFPEGTLYRRVDERLAELARLAEKGRKRA
jgi:predicted ATP-dependent protease